MKNSKNVGGAPITAGSEDLTIEVFSEADNFARTPETDNGERFGAPLYWTVENFGFDNQAGIDGIKGYDCLHLEVWWNNNAYSEHGYDISNVRLYQLADLKAGRYYFGASYPSDEANEDLYIFASDKLVNTSEISTQSIAYEKVKLASADGSFRGIFFTLEEDTKVYMGWQADFSNVVTNNLRASGVKLLYYGTMSYATLQESIAGVEDALKGVKVNENTGFYAPEALEKLMAVVDEAKKVEESADLEEINEAYNALNDAYNDFLANGKNVGGAPVATGYEDITVEVLKEADNFARTPETDNGERFGAPLYWTVENFGFDNQAGIDGIKGYDCLHLEVWWNNNAYPEHGYDISNVRLYQLADLKAGRYYFGASYPSDEANEDLYIFASDKLVNTSEISTQSIAYEKVKLASADGSFRGIFFTLEEDTKMYMGWQADFSNVVTNNLRASGVKLLRYGSGDEPDAIENVTTSFDEDAPVEIYSLQGVRLHAVPEKGVYIVKQGSKVMKYLKR